MTLLHVTLSAVASFQETRTSAGVVGGSVSKGAWQEEVWFGQFVANSQQSASAPAANKETLHFFRCCFRRASGFEAHCP